MHEVVTVQIGRQANYVGTHFWNAQESYHTFGSDEASPIDHDIHFRQGVASDGSDTYLPRALIYDLRGGFGSLARVNALGADIEEIDEGSAWSGVLTRLQNHQTEPSPFLQSLVAQQKPIFPTAATTKYFSDFASTFYHPRSLVPVTPAHPVLDPTSQTSTNDLPNFNAYNDGHALYQSIDAAQDIYDRDLRLWVEECDSLQGVQMLTSSDDAWAGFASAYIEEMRDQLGKSSIWVWGLEGLEQKELFLGARRLKAINHALAVAAFSSHASLYVPMAPPPSPSSDPASSARFDGRVLWHTSALVSAVFESVTIPIRLRASDGRRVPVLGDWEDALGDGGRRRIAETAMETGSAGHDGMSNGDGKAGTANGADRDVRMTGFQGIEDEAEEQDAINASLPIDLFQPPSTLRRDARMLRSKTFARIDTFRGPGWSVPAFDTVAARDLGLSRQGRPVVEYYQVKDPLLPLVATFPHIFVDAPPPSRTNVPGMSVRTSLRTSSAIANWIRATETMLRNTPVALLGEAMGGEEKESLRNELHTVAEMYVEGWESMDDDSDEDE